MKTVLIGPNAQGGIYLTDLTSLNLQPGDILAIKSGTYTGITLGTKVGLTGTAQAPITIINNDGRVVVNDHIRIYNSIHFKISGSGSADKYGIFSANLAISNKTSDYEVERVEIDGRGAHTGFWFKITQVADDPFTLHPNWTIRNVKIHDNYIYNTSTEGMYIGHTDPSGTQYGNNLVPVQMENVKIYNNIVENTGWDGIQLANARESAEIYNNIIRNYGTKLENSQQNGIVMGANTTGSIYNNTIISGPTGGKGAIAVFGYGNITISDNILSNPDSSTNTGDNIYINDNKLSINPDVPPVNINPPLKVAIIGNLINGSTANVVIRNANYNKTTVPGLIENNTIFNNTGRSLAQLIVSGVGDIIRDNSLNELPTTSTTTTTKAPRTIETVIIEYDDGSFKIIS